MALTIRSLNKSSFELVQVQALYESAFPIEEHLDWQWLLEQVNQDQADFMAYYDGNDFIGFTYSLKSVTSYYLLFLAVSENYRSKGYGTQILSAIANVAGDRPIFLVIEPIEKQVDNFQQRQRRLAFYEHNGYQILPYYYYENDEKYQVVSNQISASLTGFLALAKTIEQSGVMINLVEVRQ